jgi:hypothetical protein
LASTWGKIQIACEKAYVLYSETIHIWRLKNWHLKLTIVYKKIETKILWLLYIIFSYFMGSCVPLSTFRCLLFVFVVVLVSVYWFCCMSLLVLGPVSGNNRGIGRFRRLFPVVSCILTVVSSDPLP